jgi:hypothetical protein
MQSGPDKRHRLWVGRGRATDWKRKAILARVGPVPAVDSPGCPGPQLTEAKLKELAEAQRAELSGKTFDKAVKPGKEGGKGKGVASVSASMLGLGGIPPTLDALSGVACQRIIRSHVLSHPAGHPPAPAHPAAAAPPPEAGTPTTAADRLRYETW